MKLLNSLIIILFVSQACEKIPESKTPQPASYQTSIDTLIIAGKKMYDRYLTSGTGGDISVRIPDTDLFLIKAQPACTGDMDGGKIAVVNLKGEIQTRAIQPSVELDIHCKVYQIRQDVGAIMHMHAPYATAFTVVGRTIPLVTQQAKLGIGGIPVIPFSPVGSQKLIDDVSNAFKDIKVKAVMMQNHGVFVVGKDLLSMVYTAELIEETAKIALFSQSLGNPLSFEIPGIP